MKTELQKQFEDQTPTIQEVGGIEYLQAYCAWLELQVEKRGQALYIHDINNNTEYTRGYRDGWRDCCKDIKEFGI